MPASVLPTVTVTLNTAIDRVMIVPNLVPGEHLPGQTIMDYPAGKGVNVSLALSRLGRANVATGFVGRDDLRRFDSMLAAAGPGRSLSQLLTVAGRTRRNLTLLDPVNHTDTHVRDTGFEVTADDMERMAHKLGLLCRAGGVVVVGGSLPPGMDDHALQRLVAVARERRARIVFDGSGAMLKLFADAWRGEQHDKLFFMLKPNEEELRELSPDRDVADESQLLAAARELLAMSHVVVVSRGAKGAVLVTQDAAWRGSATVSQDDIANTVGCGDCMVAGLVDGVEAGLDWPDVLRRGLAAAAMNALDAGIARWSREQVVDYEPVVTVEAIEP